MCTERTQWDLAHSPSPLSKRIFKRRFPHPEGPAGNGCPICAGAKPCKCTALAALHPELLSGWDWEGNGDLTPWDVGISSHKGVKWVCDKHKTGAHRWTATPKNRCRGSGCPLCGKTARQNKSGEPQAPWSLLVACAEQACLVAPLHQSGWAEGQPACLAAVPGAACAHLITGMEHCACMQTSQMCRGVLGECWPGAALAFPSPAHGWVLSAHVPVPLPLCCCMVSTKTLCGRCHSCCTAPATPVRPGLCLADTKNMCCSEAAHVSRCPPPPGRVCPRAERHAGPCHPDHGLRAQGLVAVPQRVQQLRPPPQLAGRRSLGLQGLRPRVTSPLFGQSS